MRTYVCVILLSNAEELQSLIHRGCVKNGDNISSGHGMLSEVSQGSAVFSAGFN